MPSDPILQSLLRAVLEEPDCDLHRLAYADRCEELGDDARAEFVRVQCELATTDDPHGDRYWDGQLDEGPAYYRRRKALRSRERKLLESNRVTWLACEPMPLDAWSLDEPMPDYVYGARVRYRRGFVEVIRLTLDAFMAHAAALFAAHPITEVRLTDRDPQAHTILHGAAGPCAWYIRRTGNVLDPDDLPRCLEARLRGCLRHGRWRKYPTPEDAHAALSRACVSLGRQLAGLPMLLSTTLSPKDDTEGGKV